MTPSLHNRSRPDAGEDPPTSPWGRRHCPDCRAALDGGPIRYHCWSCAKAWYAADIVNEVDRPPVPARQAARQVRRPGHAGRQVTAQRRRPR